MPSSSDNGIVSSRAKSNDRPGPCGVSVSRPLMSSGVNMNVDSAQCWRTLSDQGTTGNGTDTCLILVIVREWIQPRFRHSVVTAGLSQTQELLTKIRTICVEIRDIKRTSQKQYIKTPFKGQDRDSPRTTDRSYNSPPRKEEEQDDKPDCSHTASTSPSLCQDYGFHAQFFTFILSNSLHFR